MLLTFTLALAITHIAPSSSIPISISGPRSGPLTRSVPVPVLLVFLLLGFAVSVDHDGMEIAELRFDNARYPLNNIDLWRLDWVVLDRWEILWLHIFGLRVRVKVQGLSNVVMRDGVHWRKIRIYNHGVLRLGNFSPIREATIISSFTSWRRYLLRELISLRIFVVDRHWRRIIALEVIEHFGKVWHWGIVTH